MIFRLELCCNMMLCKSVVSWLVIASAFGARRSPSSTNKQQPSRSPTKIAVPHLPSNTTCDFDEKVEIPAGWALLGTDTPYFQLDRESPTFNVSLKTPFFMDKYEVSNCKFAAFVSKTGYVTQAETFGWSFVHEAAVPPATLEQATQRVAAARWWVPIHGAYWHSPEGPETDISDRWNHPVVHVSKRDAETYCKAAGGRLPSEAEWEYAARGGKHQRMFPWGNIAAPSGKHRSNTFQGVFPMNNTLDDGYAWAAPVDAYGEQNSYGLYNMAGNVWEWTTTLWCPKHGVSSPGLIDDTSSHVKQPPDCARGTPASVTDKDQLDYVKKGGSFLCHRDFCFRYRLAARHKISGDSSAYNLGFRCVYDRI